MAGVLSLTFDDGYRHILDDIVPFLDEADLPGVFAIPIDRSAVETTEGLAVAAVSEWLDRAGDKHELAAHGASHQPLTKLQGEELVAELEKPHQALNASSLVYPGGAHDDSVVAIAEQYYTVARTTDYGFESRRPTDLMRLKTFNYKRTNWSLFKANVRVLWAWLTNRWLIETYHIVDDSSAAAYAVPLSDFKKHVRFIQRLGIPVRTLSQAVESSKSL